MPLKMNRSSIGPDSATVDRIDSRLGYVPGNVIVVSCKANRIKNDATVEEMYRVAFFYAALTARGEVA
jgi:hypothetical protein